MNFSDLFVKYEKDIEDMNFENMDEFKKFVDKEGVVYSQGELEQAWAHLMLRNVYEDDSLDDDALVTVAGGKGEVPSSPPPPPRPPAPQINISYNTNIVHTGGGSINGDINFNKKSDSSKA